MMKRFVRIKWTHSDPHEPVEFYYELCNGQWASRGIQVNADGSSTCVTYGLKEARVPALEEINLDPQLWGSQITEGEFETAWAELVSC